MKTIAQYIAVNNNRPPHKNPKKPKSERIRLRELAEQSALNKQRQETAHREREREYIATGPARRRMMEIAELERELRSYAGFSALTRRMLRPRIATVNTRLAHLAKGVA